MIPEPAKEALIKAREWLEFADSPHFKLVTGFLAEQGEEGKGSAFSVAKYDPYRACEIDRTRALKELIEHQVRVARKTLG